MSWTDERVEQLRKLWADGLSASQIAQELGGVTRNAVIGKVHRLGLSGRAKSTSHNAATRPKRVSRAAFATKTARPAQRTLQNPALVVSAEPETPAPPPARDPLVAPVALRLELTELTDRTCKWPIGDPTEEDFHFCGHGAKEGGPYCAYHARLAYQPVNDRKRERDRPSFAGY